MSASTAQFGRLTVAYDGGQVDLAVPANVPVRLVVSAIVAVAMRAPADPDTGWVLRTVDGVEIGVDESIREAGIKDGELVILCRRAEDVSPPLYDDIVESSDRLPFPRWSLQDTRHAVVVLSGILSLIAALALSRVDTPALAGVIGLAIGTILLASAVIGHRVGWARETSSPTAALACGWVAVGVFWGADRHLVQVRLLVVFCLLLGLAGLLYSALRVPVLIGVLISVGGLGLASCLLDRVAQVGIGPIAAAASAMSLAALPLLARISLSLARVPRPEAARTSRSDSGVSTRVEAMPGLVEAARRHLIGLNAGAMTVSAAAAAYLAATGSGLDVGLPAVAGVLVVLRARQQPIRWLWLSALLCSGTVCSVLLSRVVMSVDTEALPPIALGSMLAAAGILAWAAKRTGTSQSPRLGGWLDRLQTALALSVVPLVLGVWDVYSALRALAV